jgi:hypothetical protein
VLRVEHGIDIYSRLGVLTHRFGAPGGGDKWQGFLMRGGRELWIADFNTRIVHRYAMP